MIVKAIKTHVYTENEDLSQFIFNSIKSKIEPNDILVVTSKLLSISEKLFRDKNKINKVDLIKEEADHYLGEGLHGYHLTIKNFLIMPTAGIDQSNSNNKFLLLPKNINELTKKLHKKLSNKFGFKNWGLIISDSKTSPMRSGVTGFSLSYYGFIGVNNLRGNLDITGRALKVTTVNNVDPLAAAAVLTMGESNERQPLAIIKESNMIFKAETSPSLYIKPEDDIFSSIYLNK